MADAKPLTEEDLDDWFWQQWDEQWLDYLNGDN